MASNPPCYLLTGMHRSGTSFLGRFLLASGIDMGEELLGPHESNPHGHFEDVEVLRFHRQILASQNGGEDVAVSERPTLSEDDRARGREIVARRRAKGGAWGWKEPRTCLFLDFWMPLVPEAMFLFVYRHPAFVLDSLARRHKVDPHNREKNAQYLRAWIAYNQAMLEFYKRHRDRCVLFSLHRAVDRPAAFVELLTRRLGRPFDEATFRESFDDSALVQYNPARRRVTWALRYRAWRLRRELDRLSEI